MAAFSEISLISPRGYQRNGCGYCKRQDGGISVYAHSPSFRAEDYETMVNRGWRRSGQLFYKQNPEHSCCPHYTIRLDPTEYTPRKDQKRALNKWNKFILGTDYMRKAARLCPKTREEKKERRKNFNVPARVHEVEYGNLKRPIDPSTKRPIEPAHKFEVNLESDSLSLSKYNLFKKYQMAIHHDEEEDCSQSSFKRFLCSGLRRPLVKPGHKPLPQELPRKRLGSFHQCYRLDGQLIAVGVLDLMPYGVSSVYVFYDPDYNDYEFGKLSALREIALTIEEDYKFYYMGYYIHSCVKMRYKADYRPQYVLDPESYEWYPLADFQKELDKRRYVSLSRDKKWTEEELEKQEEPDRLGLPDEEQMSLFDVRMPGVMTIEEVKSQIDLDHWGLLVEGTLVEMCDLVAWEKSDIMKPHAIKGIMGELAASLGPELFKHTIVILF